MVKFTTLEHLLTQFGEHDKKFNSANLLKRRQTVSLHSRLFVYKTSVQDSLSRGFADVTFSDFFAELSHCVTTSTSYVVLPWT